MTARLKKLTYFHWVFLAVMFICAATVALSVVVYVSDSQKGAAAHAALCAVEVKDRADYANGVKFIKEHPNGAFGFTVLEIKTSNSLLKRTIETLHENLNC